MFKLIIAAVLLGLSIFSLSPDFETRGSGLKTAWGEPETVRWIVLKAGEKYGVSFTVEEAKTEGSSLSLLNYSPSPPPSQPNLQGLLEFLHKNVPHFDYQVGSANPKIVHIFDDRLPKQQGYALGSIIDGIDLKGDENKLISALQSKGVHISIPSQFSESEMVSVNLFLAGYVTGKELTVREILTKFVPPSKHHGIIWKTMTKVEKDAATTLWFY